MDSISGKTTAGLSNPSPLSLFQYLSSFTLPPNDGTIRVCVGGGAGFIGSHIAKRMKDAGYYVRCVDWVKNEFMADDDFCSEFVLGDLRKLDVAIETTKDCKYVFNLAADMGGMGFIER